MDRYEKTMPTSEVLDDVLKRMDRLAAKAAEQRALFRDWFTKQDPQPSACDKHGNLRQPDFDQSVHDSLRTGRFQVVYGPCADCVSERAEAECRQWLVRRGVPENVSHGTFSNYVPLTQFEREALAACEHWAKQPTGFLVLHGNIGSGKSHLLAAIIRAAGYGRYRTHERIVRELRAGYGSDAPQRAAQAEFERNRTCSLLCWDEFGLGASGADVPDMIHSILCHRFENRLPVALAFNGPLGPFKTLIGDRMESRLREAIHGEPLPFDGPDRRPKRNHLYHQPDGSDFHR